jgi:peroxiredoxin Q/BCP
MKIRALFSILCSMLFLSPVKASPLAVGADAPKLTVKDQDGKDVSLADLYTKGITLVFFYPKASTPGCTKEACALRDGLDGLNKLGIQVVGVSMDNQVDQKRFSDKEKLTFSLLADEKGEVVKAFGVSEIRPGFPSRQSFLVKDGKIAWHQPKVDPGTHLDEVTKAAEGLKAGEKKEKPAEDKK